MITFRYWLRNLFTDADGEWRDWRPVVFIPLGAIGGGLLMTALIVGIVGLTGGFRQTATVIVIQPGRSPATVIVDQP